MLDISCLVVKQANLRLALGSRSLDLVTVNIPKPSEWPGIGLGLGSKAPELRDVHRAGCNASNPESEEGQKIPCNVSCGPAPTYRSRDLSFRGAPEIRVFRAGHVCPGLCWVRCHQDALIRLPSPRVSSRLLRTRCEVLELGGMVVRRYLLKLLRLLCTGVRS